MYLTYVGEIDTRGAVYPIINRNLTNALAAKYTIIHNIHNIDSELTPLAIAHEYPVMPLNVRHPFNVCCTAWEFATPGGFPLRKIKAINTYDLLLTPSRWVKEQVQAALDIPVEAIYWGVDALERKRYQTKKQTLDVPPDAIKILWVGGTDARHGFDVAMQVLERLPDNYYLIAKQSKHYPKDARQHARLRIIHEDLPSIYPLYNACDLFLQTARGVGYSLPVLEALCVGLPVVSTDLPPIREFKTERIIFSSKGQWEYMAHHLYEDCRPVWWEPDVEDLTQAVLSVQDFSHKKPEESFYDFYSWKNAAKVLLEKVEQYVS